MTNYRELKVWQKAMDLVTQTYQLVKLLPKEEMYALSSQIRRAAVSIPSNIAEGAGRKSPRDFGHFLRIAYGSMNELETQLLLCCRLGYLEEAQLENAMQLSSEIGKMINAILAKLKTDN